MTNNEFNALVSTELQAIPRGDLPQNLYRAAYEQARLNSLGSHPELAPTPDAAHQFALDLVQRHHPSFLAERREPPNPSQSGPAREP